MSDVKLNNSSLFSNYLYINIDNIREYFTIQLISVVLNYKRDFGSIDNLEVSILIYKNNKHLNLFYNWKNPNYFILAFIILFLFDNGDYFLIFNFARKVNLSLEVWSKYALYPHFRGYNYQLLFSIIRY